MKSRRLVKKFLLGVAAAAALALPLIAGLALEQTADAQQSATPPAAPNATTGRIEYLPIVKVAPTYPPRAVARGLEGYVMVSFTVTADGSVADPTVLESSSTLFEQSALDATRKFKYKPRLENGVPVTTEGVVTRIEYVLDDKDEDPANP